MRKFISNTETRWNKEYINIKLCYILLFFSLMLFFFSVYKLKYTIVDINDFLGLTSHLPIEYWLGLVIVLIVALLIFIYKGISDWIYLLVLFILGIYLFGLGIFIEENARLSVAYYPIGEVINLIKFYHLDISTPYPLISYRFWPGLHFFSAFLIITSGITLFKMIQYLPLFWIFIVVLIIFAIGKRFNLRSDKIFFAGFVFLCAFWLPQYYYSAQSLAYISFLLLFYFSISSINNSKETLLAGVLFTSTIITHLVTSLITLMATFLKSIYKRDIIIFIIFLAILLVYYIYFINFIFSYGLLEFKNQAFNFDIFSLIENPKFHSSSAIKEIVNYFRITYLVTFVIFIAISIYFLIKNKTINSEKISYCITWLLAASFLFFINYGNEQFERVYLFCLIPAIFFIIFCIENKKILVIFLILVFVLHIPAHYGSESFEQTLNSELTGAKFSANKAEFYSLGIDMHYMAFYNPDIIKNPTYFYMWMGQYNSTLVKEVNPLKYSDKVKYRMDYYLNTDPVKDYLIKNSQNYNLIYSNRGFELYEERK